MEQFYAAYRGGLAAYAMSITKKRELAEDLVQETFLRAMANMEDLNGMDDKACRAWLCKTAKNLYVDQIRKLSRETDGVLPETVAFEQDLSQSAVTQLVGRLPETERAIFILRYFEGYNARELGEMFSLPAGTVRSRLASARGRLRKWIQE